MTYNIVKLHVLLLTIPTISALPDFLPNNDAENQEGLTFGGFFKSLGGVDSGPEPSAAPSMFPSAAPTIAPITAAPVTAAPVTPSPVTSAPVTPSPVTNSPETSAPVTPSPVTNSPVSPAPISDAPVTNAPITPAPASSAPVTSAPMASAPVTPAPATPAPVSTAPVSSAPVTAAPVTSSPVTPAPISSAPVTSAPVTAAPITSAPVTSAPVSSAPVTSAPVTSAPAVSRTSTHKLQWGSVTDGCEYNTPVAFLSCGDGGWITVTSIEDAKCDQLNLDYVKCTALDSTLEDAFVDFTCTGFTAEHLTATAKIYPSEATDCDKLYSSVQDGAQTTTVVGGNAIAFATLGRECLNEDDEMELVNTYPCVEGLEGEDGDVIFCAAGDMCTDQQTCGSFCIGTPSCDLEVDALEMTNTDDLEKCSELDTVGIIPYGYTLSPSTLASYHAVEWTFSAQGNLCAWPVPDVTFTCDAGGTIELDQDQTFCSATEHSITCSDPNPMSQEERVSIVLGIWCYGESDEQLVLSAMSPIANDPGAVCQPGGMAVQGIRIARGCGTFGASDFQYVVDPQFCADPDQLHGDSGICFAGDGCNPTTTGTCTPVVPPVTVEANTVSVRNCIYAV